MFFDTLARLAFTALLKRPGSASEPMLHQLASGLAGLVAVLVLGLMSATAAAVGILLSVMPNIDTPHLLFWLASGLLLVAILIWFIVCGGRSPSQVVTDALKSHSSPLDSVGDAVDRAARAFTRGWSNLR